MNSRLILLTSTVASFWCTGSALTLGPVKNHHHNHGNHVSPTRNVSLSYGVGDRSLVNATLAFHRPAVVLEDILSVQSVNCSDSAIVIVFNGTDEFSTAAASWSSAQSLLFITNHMGDCDAELERGFFVSNDVETIPASLTLVAKTAKAAASDVSVVDSSRRDISWDPSLTIANSLAVPSSTILYTYAPYVTITADHASVSLSSTLSGNLKYSVSQAALTELTVDFDTTLSADLGITAEVGAPYNTTFSYSAPALSYDLVNIPGILVIGPELLFGVGVDLAASGAATVTADVGVAVADGNVHLDFRNSSGTTISGWTPTYSSTVNITEKAAVSVDPFIDLSVDLAFKVLDGLLDLSIGLDAQPRFNNDFTLTAAQDVSPTGVDQPTATGVCDQGVEVVSEFVFNLFANVTQFWSDTIYSVTIPIADECYSWL
ncbi:hypothetical protein Sste5344_008623 [Sporothrix stenoceras]